MDEYQIVELVKDWYREGHRESAYVQYYVLVNGNRISFVPPPSFHESNKHGQISDRAIGSIDLYEVIRSRIESFEFPMFDRSVEIVELYVYKRGYVLVDQTHGRYPLPNLKYFIRVAEYENRLAIELVDLDVVANNLNLPKIISSVLGPKLLSENNMIGNDKLGEIDERMSSQKLFAGYTWDDANFIAFLYFGGHERELSKDVFKISEAYQRVFRPYRVVYNTKTWEQVLM